MDIERKIREELTKMAGESRGAEPMPNSARGRIRRRRFLAASAGGLGVLLLLVGGPLLFRSFTQDSDRPSPARDAIPDVAEVRCDPGGGVQAPEQVRTQPDGVHFNFVPLPGMKLVEAFPVPAPGRLAVVAIERPLQRVDSTKGPAPRWFGCVGEDVLPQFVLQVQEEAKASTPSDSLAQNFERMEVVNTDAAYVEPPRLPDCTDGLINGGDEPYGFPPEGEKGDLVEVVRKEWGRRFEGPVDISLSGYPEGTEPVVVGTRDERVLLIIRTSSDGDGGWFLRSSMHCNDL